MMDAKQLSFRGKTISQWAESLGVRRHTIHMRILNGWSIEKAVTTPVERRRPKDEKIAFRGQEKTIAEWAAEIGIKPHTLYLRIAIYNWPLEKAMTKNVRHSYHGFSARDDEGRTATEYTIWAGMIQRCTNANHISFPRYGAKGIKVCERWMDFPNFLDDMGRRPSPRHSLERKRRSGDYEPGNVVWALPRVQARNTSRNRFITFNGKTLTLADWAVRTGLPLRTLGNRLDLLGWSVERALTTPQRTKAR